MSHTMPQTDFEKALAFYADLDAHLDKIPAQNAIFPHSTPTSYAIEKAMLLDKKRKEQQDALPSAHDSYWMGIADNADASPALRLKRVMDEMRDEERQIVIQRAAALEQALNAPAVFAFRELAKEFADKMRITKESRNKMQHAESEQSDLMNKHDASRGMWGGMHEGLQIG